MFLDVLNVMLQGILMGMSNQYSRMWTGLEIKRWQSLGRGGLYDVSEENTGKNREMAKD